MNTFFTRLMILMVLLSTPVYLMAADEAEEYSEQETVQVFKARAKVEKGSLESVN